MSGRQIASSAAAAAWRVAGGRRQESRVAMLFLRSFDDAQRASATGRRNQCSNRPVDVLRLSEMREGDAGGSPASR